MKIENGDVVKRNHKWRKGGFPQLCLRCGILRSRKTFKLRMAIVGSKDYYAYETKMVYTDINKTTHVRPSCINTTSHEN